MIYQATKWQVEHAYPSSLLGWLVIVLRRHTEALHHLKQDEAIELGLLQRAVAAALHEKLSTVKEYAVCYGEAPGFGHLHIHIVPRDIDMDNAFKGDGIFCIMKWVVEAELPARGSGC